jgi:hypothetical protein
VVAAWEVRRGTAQRSWRVRLLIRLVCFFLGLVIGAAAGAAEVADVPVDVGGDPSQDACVTLGTVVGLDPRGDNFLSVRSGPNVQFRRLDRITTGQHVWICGSNGNWYSIVYSRTEDDCGVASPISERREYVGPCRRGWVHKKYIMPIAG